MDAAATCTKSGGLVFTIVSGFFQIPAQSTAEFVLFIAWDWVVSPLATFNKSIQRFERIAGLAEQPEDVSNGGRANTDLGGFCCRCSRTGD
jgi:ABC-type multidrug transport system permease subunit